MAGILWTIIVVLAVLWIAGLVLNLFGPFLHFIIVIAAVLFVINMFMGRSRV